MKELEKKIEEAAINCADIIYDDTSEKWKVMCGAFKDGVKSTEAKEYWQQGMYTEEEVRGKARDAFNQAISFFHIESNNSADFRFNTWWSQNKKKS